MSAVDWAEAHRRVEALGRALQGEASPERAREVLAARARLLARRPPEPPRGGEVHLVTFSLAGETYAVEAKWVSEVARLERATPLPGAVPPRIAVTAWRGELLPLVDLRALLGLGSAAADARPWMVVLGGERPSLGLPVDAPGEFRIVPAASLPPPAPDARPHVRALTADAVVVLDGAGVIAAGG